MELTFKKGDQVILKLTKQRAVVKEYKDKLPWGNLVKVLILEEGLFDKGSLEEFKPEALGLFVDSKELLINAFVNTIKADLNFFNIVHPASPLTMDDIANHLSKKK